MQRSLPYLSRHLALQSFGNSFSFVLSVIKPCEGVGPAGDQVLRLVSENAAVLVASY